MTVYAGSTQLNGQYLFINSGYGNNFLLGRPNSSKPTTAGWSGPIDAGFEVFWNSINVGVGQTDFLNYSGGSNVGGFTFSTINASVAPTNLMELKKGLAIHNTNVSINKTTNAHALDVNGSGNFSGSIISSTVVSSGSSLQLGVSGSPNSVGVFSNSLQINNYLYINSFTNNFVFGRNNSLRPTANLNTGSPLIREGLEIFWNGVNSGKGQTDFFNYAQGTLNEGGFTFSTVSATVAPKSILDLKTNLSIFNTNVSINRTDNSYTLDVNGTGRFYGTCTATSFNATSDHRIKTNVVNLNDTEFTIDNLRPLHYYNTQLKKPDMGFIAHEVQQEFPFLVNGEKDATEYQSVNYNGFIALLVKEIQNLKMEMHTLKTEIQILKSKL
jgi:hypothetical protein